jgi:hypothetical protein
LLELDQEPMRASFWGEFRGEEFIERLAGGQRQEKIGERVAQCVSDDQFGGGGGTVGDA